MTADGTPTPRTGETITVPRPHVPTGPKDVDRDIADVAYLRSAVRNIEYAASHGRSLWGSGVTMMLIRLLTDAADAITGLDAPPPATTDKALCARCAVGVDAERVAEVTAVLSAATQLVLVSAMRPEEAIRSTVAALAVMSGAHKAAALYDAAQGRDLVRERLATAEELRQDIGRISARSADGVPTSALAVALADAGWVKVPLAETSGGR